MKRIVTACLLTLLSLAALAAEKKGTPADPDYKALTILAKNCAGCHQAADHPGALFLNQARLSEVETISLIKKLVETNQMPPAHEEFKKSADGKELIKWLRKKEKEMKKAK